MQAPAIYPPIEDYGLIGNCHSAALISSGGSLDWLCLPRFDSPSLFARVLDHHRGGGWSINPTGRFQAQHRYLDDTNVLETTFTTARGRVRLLDFMPVAPTAAGGTTTAPYALVRIVEGVAGESEIDCICTPLPDYARRAPSFELRGNTVAFDGFSLNGPSPWQLDAATGTLTCRLSLQDGERAAFTLQVEEGAATAAVQDPFAALQATIDFWRQWAAMCTYDGPYRPMVVRSALALKLCIYTPTGAIVAAPTTSLPEEIGGVRNWDYRFSWIRDASFTLYALLLAGYVDEDDPFFAWIVRTVQLAGTGIHILYPISPDGTVEEQTLDHLEGYRGSAPVRIGNGAWNQIQLDVYGEVLDALHFAWKVGRFNPADVWAHFRPLVDWVVDNWQQPDSGIWEVRGGLRNFVYGKVMCWVALDRAIAMAEALGLPGDIERWRSERERIRETVLEHGWSDTLGAFKQSFEDDQLDASNLLLPVVGFIEGDDPRMLATIDATLEHLVVDDLCYRYLDAPEGLSGGEATFVLCTFWLIDALILAGREDEAQRLFERTLSRATSLGLYAEEIDPTTGAHLGNFPQAFSHIGLINAAVSLAHAGTVGVLDMDNIALADECTTGVSGARRTRRARAAVQERNDGAP
ncbi:MAG: glycoside hydrolase family 15 protein [Chloroflexota bacterium]|nr:glycoside hydrolase family 15 protein [Chloroflexota bacterium]